MTTPGGGDALNVLHHRADERLRVDDVEGALTLLREALALAPRDAVSLRMIETAERRREQLANVPAPGKEPSTARADEFAALMRARRHREAVALGERILDDGPVLSDLRAFWDPWTWSETSSRDQRISDADLPGMEKALGPDDPWLLYYRADLVGPYRGLGGFERVARLPSARYGWMLIKSGTAALETGNFERAVEWLEASLKSCALDWRARCYLAEAHLCLGRRMLAFAEMTRALKMSSEKEKGEVLAWRGELHLWLGEYEDALAVLEEACALGAKHAFAWKGAALLKLGKPREALRQLNEALSLHPLDFEAFIWRAEAQRELGMHAEALADLKRTEPATSAYRIPILLWALFNRALAKGALKDLAGMKADYEAIPAEIIAHIRAETGAEGIENVLTAGLKLSRGFRREEYRQAIWMPPLIS